MNRFCDPGLVLLIASSQNLGQYPWSIHVSYYQCWGLLSHNFATNPFALGARLVWVVQGVHDNVGHDLDVILVRDI